jgi:hypothetical protein
MAYPECPFGLNMIFRRETLQQIGEFNPALGRRAGKLLSNDETEYFLRLANANLCVRYAPAALLYHRIPAARMTRRWLGSRHYWQGISDATLAQVQQPRSRAGLLRRAVKDVWDVFGEVWANRLWRPRARRRALSSPAAAGFRLAHRLGRIHGRLREAARRQTPDHKDDADSVAQASSSRRRKPLSRIDRPDTWFELNSPSRSSSVGTTSSEDRRP